MGLTPRLVALLAAFWPVWRWWGERIASDPDAAGALVALIPAGLLLIGAGKSSVDDGVGSFAKFIPSEAEGLGMTSSSAVVTPCEARNHIRRFVPARAFPMIRKWAASFIEKYPRRPPSRWTLCLLGVYIASFPVLPPLARALLAITILLVESRHVVADRTVFLPVAMLVLLSLPALATSQFFLGYPLRIVVGAGAAWILRLYGFAVIRDGVLLSWGDESFSVDAPCSGVRMLWAAAVLVLFLAGHGRLAWRRSVALAASAGIAVIGANIFRAVLFFLAARAEVSLDGWRHDAAGGVVFAFAIAAIALAGVRLRRTVPCEA